MKEEVVLLGDNHSLVGIVTEPAENANKALPGVILFNAGLIHRVGPNRLYVRLARRLAEMGMVVLRFDLSGVGDSKRRTDNMSLQESILDDARQAMDYLGRTRGINRFLMMGHCSGALVSLGIAGQDARAAGVVLINAEGGDTQWDAYDQKRKASRYYANYYGRNAIRDADKWKKLLTGQANYGSIARNIFQTVLWNKVAAAGFKLKKTMLSGQQNATRPEIAAIFSVLPSLLERGTQVLVLYYEGSTGLQRTQLLIRDALKQTDKPGKIKLEIIPQADHNFTLLESQDRLLDAVAVWCQTALHVPAQTPVP